MRESVALGAAKLEALVRGTWGAGARRSEAFGTGTGLVASYTSEVWVLLDGDRAPGLGAALVWADRVVGDRASLPGLEAAVAGADRLGGGQGHPRLHVVAEHDAGRLARQADYVAEPSPEVWAISGTQLVRAEPAPLADRADPVAPPELVDLMIDAGLEIVLDWGVVRGEVNGLEVARITDARAAGESSGRSAVVGGLSGHDDRPETSGPSASDRAGSWEGHSDGVPGVSAVEQAQVKAGEGPAAVDQARLEVGVGAADRELTAMVHGELAPVDQLARVVEIVRGHRWRGAPPHPLNQLVPERWMRAELVRDPGLIGLASLRPTEGARPRSGLRNRGIAVAEGRTGDGRAVVVACSVGVDLELVPEAADARAAVDPEAELWLALPARDVQPATAAIAARLVDPARVVIIPD